LSLSIYCHNTANRTSKSRQISAPIVPIVLVPNRTLWFWFLFTLPE